MSTPCTWPGCLTEAQQVELARTLDDDAPAAPDQRLVCRCDEAPKSNEWEIENG